MELKVGRHTPVMVLYPLVITQTALEPLTTHPDEDTLWSKVENNLTVML